MAEPNTPIETLRDGNLKAAIWKNEGENGAYFSVTLAKTWKDDRGKFHDTQSFSGTDLLRVAELSRSAYARSNELRREYYQSNEMDDEPMRERSQAGREFTRSRAPARTRGR
ncbi:MAG: hypothetical protein AAFX08_08365 [Pseudomonadota bacterium]